MPTDLIQRDTSWLHFNFRVLQEAMDKRVPLYERIKFLAIYSANLDEFYRVRVASLRQFKKLPKDQRKELLDFKPKSELKTIHAMVNQQQQIFGQIFVEDILPELKRENIHLIHSYEMNAEQQQFAREYFIKNVQPHLELYWLPSAEEAGVGLPFLKNGQLCLAVNLTENAALEAGEVPLVPIPTDKLPRLVVLPSPAETPDAFHVIFLDSIMRANLGFWLNRGVEFAYSFKLSRDAELYIDDEFDGELHRKIEARLAEREDGLPTRFLYDAAMPAWIRQRLKDVLDLSKFDMIPGARYHNFNDFFSFPLPPGREDLKYADLPPLDHPHLREGKSVMQTMAAGDVLLSFPYQRYDYIPKLIEEAANHPEVTRIRITLYRVAGKSAVVTNLLYALKMGKKVEAFVETKARFDEASNLYWGKELEDAGAIVRYSFPAVKVHTKLLHILRERDGKDLHYSYIGTGNFNEKTAKLYTDHALLTCRPELGKDIERVFQLLRGKLILPNCKHLLVAPFNMQWAFDKLVDEEIAHARAGHHAYLFLKMNSLEEPGMIAKIREAAAAGVEVRMIVRGICCLMPGPDENIEIISIIDRFLEHARIFIFGGDEVEKVFIGSADWMDRNLHRRVEVVTPVEDPLLRKEIRQLMDLQWRDNSKARIISAERLNEYRTPEVDENSFRAQLDIYDYFRAQLAMHKRHKPGKV
ncbi:polyphosphate kinase 1 [Neolewinella lacunae]|uniref:Polyphosphate kinase n=1 Tax=Neolewinella lacunae TaxID=1517758 RepID=A0A923PLL1_9BACT|nr:polyphosphate kinase 1 [Neolewinella lacunae]MBC6993544.1 polyphosphate kinase 1 [Neolewinella lacunae]MDN3636180.1 polyphosphate kinase 1 [Neolewinella lacunae]